MMLLAYLELHFPGSDMENQAQLLHSHLEQLEPTEAETRDGEDSGWVVWVSGECMGLGHTEKSFQKRVRQDPRVTHITVPWSAVWRTSWDVVLN